MGLMLWGSEVVGFKRLRGTYVEGSQGSWGSGCCRLGGSGRRFPRVHVRGPLQGATCIQERGSFWGGLLRSWEPVLRGPSSRCAGLSRLSSALKVYQPQCTQSSRQNPRATGWIKDCRHIFGMDAGFHIGMIDSGP